MTFLRLSTSCAVFDDDGRVLLSKRGDLNVWNLPGGRLDSGETLSAAAAREVREETGLIVHVERPVGLYYWQGWDRLNILYTGFPVGGELAATTYETRANRFFALDQLPGAMLDTAFIRDATLRHPPAPRIITTDPADLRRVRLALRRRYLTNLLRGKPEPRHVRFNVQAVGLVWIRARDAVLTIPNRRLRALPRVVADGTPLWQQLATDLRRYLDADLAFQWVGSWQDAASDTLDFVFAARTYEGIPRNGAEWTTTRNGALNERDAAYLAATAPDFEYAPIWSRLAQDPAADTTIDLPRQ